MGPRNDGRVLTTGERLRGQPRTATSKATPVQWCGAGSGAAVEAPAILGFGSGPTLRLWAGHWLEPAAKDGRGVMASAHLRVYNRRAGQTDRPSARPAGAGGRDGRVCAGFRVPVAGAG